MNYKRDARQSHKPEPNGRDNCQTPPYAILPLLPYLDTGWTIREPAMGEGLLAQAFIDKVFIVVSTGYYDISITNPPFSESAKWMKSFYETGKPWCLLLKSEIVANQGIQKLITQYGELEMIYPESRINFKMPIKGWATGAQFNTHWYTFGLNIGKPNTWLCPINEEKKAFHLALKKEL